MSEYEQGYKDGSEDASAYKMGLYRIAAFGAIRRAAEVAREYDRIADTAPYNASGRAALYNRARAVRHAIRVAIGSDKR